MDLPYKRVSCRECISHSLCCVLSYDCTEEKEDIFDMLLHGSGSGNTSSDPIVELDSVLRAAERDVR